MNQNKPIAITMLIKDGGYEQLAIPTKMMAQLAVAIREKGVETVATSEQRLLHVVGFMVTGKQTGERVIMLGKGEGDGKG